MSLNKGDRIKVFYRATLMDGLEFDSSPSGEPAEFVVGEGEMVPGMEKSIVGMSVGQNKVETYTPQQAFGEYKKELVQTVPRSELPGSVKLEKGMKIHAPSGADGALLATITDLDKETVTLDGNHPLAGKNVRYEFQLAEVVAPQPAPQAVPVTEGDMDDVILKVSAVENESESSK